MTVGEQVRRWYHVATRSERVMTALAVSVAATVFLLSIVLQPDDRAAVASGRPTATNNELGGIPGSPGNESSSSEPGNAGVGTASGGVPGATAPASGVAGPTSPAAAGAAGLLTASDRGISSSKIKIGFLTQNTAGLSGAGFSTGQRGDIAEYINAIAAWANRNGGVAGRELVPVHRLTDPTSVEDQAAACRAMISDHKVFTIVDVATILDTAALDCIVNPSKGDTPLVHSAMWSRQWQERSGGNEISYQAAVDRIAITWARDLAEMGWFPPGATVGVLGDRCPATEPALKDVLGPELMARGAGKVVFGLHDCDIQSVVSQPPNIVTQLRLAGVSHVLITSNFVTAQVFTTVAQAQGWHPKYAASDWFLNTSDATTANFNPDQFDGAVGIASLGTMLFDSGKQPYDGWQTCSQIAVEAGLPPIEPGDASSEELLHVCDNFLLMLAAISAAGPNPTRASWRAGVPTLGRQQSAVFGPSTFGPGKLTGSDFVHTLQWQRGCHCWRSVSDFRPAAA